MAERALGKEYASILQENKIDAIGRPDVQITKIAKGQPLGFKISTATMPEVTVGDYKKAAAETMKNTEEITVEDTDVEEVIQQVRTQYAAQQSAEQQGATSNDDNTADDDPSTGSGQATEADSSGDSSDNTTNSASGAPQANLPELTDEFVQSLGDFKDVADFREKVKENVKQEKEQKARQKKRMEMMDAIIADSTIEVPEKLIQEEMNKMMAQFENDVSRMGLQFDEYLKHVGKDKEQMREEWRPDAEKNAKVQLLLNKIAAEEDIHPDKQRVEDETKKILEHYKDASGDRARNYVETILTNEAVFEFLEKQKQDA